MTAEWQLFQNRQSPKGEIFYCIKASRTQEIINYSSKGTSFYTLLAVLWNRQHYLLYAIRAAMKGYVFATNSSIIFGLDSFYDG
jgi:hypothetical protein